MSQAGENQPSALRAARERTRAEITRQILDTARRHLATEGASGLSLRAIARELGASSSGVYRYVASRDELLTRLIVAAYDALGIAAEAEEAAVARGDLAGRWSAVCAAVRGWALANPNEYALIYGTPVPGYVAPPTTIAPAARVSTVVLRILTDAAGHLTPAVAEDKMPPGGREALAPLRSIAGPGVPDALLQRGLMALTALGLLRRVRPALGGADRHRSRPRRPRSPEAQTPAGARRDSGDNRHSPGPREQHQPGRGRSELMTSAPPGETRATGQRLDPNTPLS